VKSYIPRKAKQAQEETEREEAGKTQLGRAQNNYSNVGIYRKIMINHDKPLGL
jgi:hypothetical protein